MLTSKELKGYAHQRKLKTLDQAWKDYIQDQVLYLLYSRSPSLVFRGGTSIWKVLKGNRFSEDLDLCKGKEELQNLEDYLGKELELRGFEVDIKKDRETDNMLFIKLGVSSPARHRETTVPVEILKTKEIEETKEYELHSPYPDIPLFNVKLPSLQELVKDKLSAVQGRNRARDLHDLYFLLKHGATINPEEAKEINIEEFKEKMMEKKNQWSSLESLITGKLPSFKKETKYIEKKLKKAKE